jgi:hypothetical protein
MALSQLSKFLTEATGFIRPDAVAVDEAGDSAHGATRYHRRIVVIAGCCGAIAAIGGAVAALLQPPDAKDFLKVLLMMPPMFAVIGILEGVAVACLFAPREFLSGPVGQKWMSLIGTKSVIGARITCALLVLAVPGVPAFLALISSFGRRS